VELAKDIKFAKMHVFSFSSRKGTAAYYMKPTVQWQIIKERSQILHYLDKQLGSQFREQFLGQEQVILTESCDDNQRAEVIGRTERYFIVKVEAQCKGIGKNQLVKVKPIENKTDCMLGRLVEIV
jgi:threonylcarbamoyladenosine tRNA methylthiotransferase MtaB